MQNKKFQLKINNKRVFIEYVYNGVNLWFNKECYFLAETHKSTIKKILKKVILNDYYHLLIKV